MTTCLRSYHRNVHHLLASLRQMLVHNPYEQQTNFKYRECVKRTLLLYCMCGELSTITGRAVGTDVNEKNIKESPIYCPALTRWSNAHKLTEWAMQGTRH